MGSQAIWQITGYLPQEVELFPGTIKDNVCRMRADLPDEKIYDAAVLTDVHDMICQLPNGYETIMERSGAPLSGGQKQRIALARAFGDLALVVLDEPNSNLDFAGEQALTDTLLRAKEKRVTVVVITQRPAVLNTMDKLLVLRGGEWKRWATKRGSRPPRSSSNSRAPAPGIERISPPPREHEGAISKEAAQ